MRTLFSSGRFEDMKKILQISFKLYPSRVYYIGTLKTPITAQCFEEFFTKTVDLSFSPFFVSKISLSTWSEDQPELLSSGGHCL